MVSVCIAVPGGVGRDYDVLIGAGVSGSLGELLRTRLRSAGYAVIADENVAGLYGSQLERSLGSAGALITTLTFPAGERHKNRDTWARLSDALLEAGLGRDGCIVSVGGGVAGDLAGFVAATFLRGVPYVQVPTSLLAMADAAVGGKTGVNVATAKNAIGAIHPPALVVIDPHFLGTLPDPEFHTGLVECIKHAAVHDAGYLDWLRARAPALLARDEEAISELIRRSVEIKARFVSADVQDRGIRQALNFGHTLGHALEAASEYGMSHGEAVARGMVVEARLGEHLGITRPGTALILAEVLSSFSLPTELPAGSGDELLRAVRFDKKNLQGEPRFALLARPGELASFTSETTARSWTHPVAWQQLSDWLDLEARKSCGDRA